MKLFRNKNTETILFVDGDRWRTNTMSGWYRLMLGTMIDHIVTGRQQGWEKIGVKTYYEKILL
jgi:hypothetical protein